MNILGPPKNILGPVSPIKPISAPALPPPPEADDDRRLFGDTARTRKNIYSKVLSAAQAIQPIANKTHTLRLSDVDWADPEDFKIADQKHALLSGATLSRRLRGTWELVDNADNSVLDTLKATVAKVPYLTQRGTMINNGSEYALRNQQRLKAGIYTRRKDNGEIESHVNVLPGKGLSHRYFLDPAKSTFHLRVSQAKLPLFPLLKSLGATDDQIRTAWGNDFYAANAVKREDPVAVNKLFTRFVGTKNDIQDLGGRTKALAEAITRMEIDPEVSQRNLGKPYSTLSLDAILDTTKKLIAVSRGEQDVDDRDALPNQVVLGPEDLLAERLEKDAGGIRRNLLWKASFRRSLKGLPVGALTKQVESALLGSGLGQALEEVNAAEILDKQTSISRLGEGGIPSLTAVPDEARALQPSQLGFMDAVRTPESLRAGVDVFLSGSVRKGNDGRIYAPVIDVSTGQTVYKSPQDLANAAVAFPDGFASPGKRTVGMLNGKMRYIHKKDVRYLIPHMEATFSPLGNLVPLKSGMKGQRVAMASRMITQAIGLAEPEAPFVQNGLPDRTDRSYEEEFGSFMGAVRANNGGTVVDVTPDVIKVRYDDGQEVEHELYNNFPFNRKSQIHNTSMVQPGQRIEKDALLARSNFTDATGATALGRNLRVAYIPFRGLNFEDAALISESAAKKLTSEQTYQHNVASDDKTKFGKGDFVGMFGSKYTRAVLDKLDNDGVVKPGTTIEYGEPLILAARQREAAYNKIHRKGETAYSDASEIWEHHEPGIVTDVLKTPKGHVVVVKSASQMQVGDKLSGRFGDKGVVAGIIPDHLMPHDRDGKPFEILANPLGIISRGNPSQMVEGALGKISELTGQVYKVPDFSADRPDMVRWAMQELKKHGLSDLEDIYDPSKQIKIPRVFTGNRFFMKLHHMAASKAAGRGTGGYTQTGEPARGGAEGSKSVGLLDSNALLSHGAIETRRDAALIRGQRNEDFWLPFMQGFTPPQPKVPMVFEKFVNDLKSAGVNVVPDGPRLNIMALTDKDIDTLAGDRIITSADTVRLEDGLKPIKGGLFDEALTGGHGGKRWSYIPLHEPMVNPIMEEPVRRLLGLTEQQLEDTIAGKHKISTGTGPKAVHMALTMINVDKAIEQARAEIHSGRKTSRDQATRRLGYLKSAKALGIHPKNWMLTKAPVLPPAFRPISVMSDSGLPLVADPNYLYKELFEANKNLADMSNEVDDVGDERLALYHSLKAVTGLGNPVHPKLITKNIQGVLKKVFGSSPKYSTLQRKLLAQNVDLVGRAVVAPDPDLDMDHIGIPEVKAWELYRNFIVRRLKRRGMAVTDALRHIENRSPLARVEMLAEMDERPVIMTRAPVLHKFGVQAFLPQLVKGDALRVSPLIVKGFGMDFDGDAANYHVPVSDEARKEALERMLPSRNLFSPGDFKSPVHQPSQELTGGLYAMSTGDDGKAPRVFRNAQDAVQAWRRGEIGVDSNVVIME